MNNFLTVRLAKHRRGAVSIVAAVVVAIVVASVVAYLAYYHFAHKDLEPMTAYALKVAPADTQLFVAYDGTLPGSGAEEQAKLLELFLQSPECRSISTSLLDNKKLNLEEDVLTWATPCAAVMASYKTIPPVEGLLPGMPSFAAAIMRVSDDSRCRQSLLKIQAQYEAEKQVKYQVAEDNAEFHYADGAPAWAVKQGYLYVANSLEALRIVIAPREAKASLASTPRFIKAVAPLKYRDSMVGYADIQGISQAVLDKSVLDKLPADLQAFIQSFTTAAGGSGSKNGSMITEAYLNVDPAGYGSLGKAIFNQENNRHFKALSTHPESSDIFVDVDTNVLATIIQAVINSNPKFTEAAKAPDQFLSQYGLKFQDIYNPLSGEIAYSSQQVGTLQGMSLLELLSSDEKKLEPPNLGSLARVPLCVSIGIKNSDSLDKLFSKVPAIKLLLGTYSHQVVGDYKIYDFGNGGQGFVLALGSNDLMLALNEPAQGLGSRLAANAQGVMAKSSIFSTSDSPIKANCKGLCLTYENVGQYYGEIAAVLRSSGKCSEALCAMFELMSDHFNRRLSLLQVGKTGFKMTVYAEMKSEAEAQLAREKREKAAAGK